MTFRVVKLKASPGDGVFDCQSLVAYLEQGASKDCPMNIYGYTAYIDILRVCLIVLSFILYLLLRISILYGARVEAGSGDHV